MQQPLQCRTEIINELSKERNQQWPVNLTFDVARFILLKLYRILYINSGRANATRRERYEALIEKLTTIQTSNNPIETSNVAGEEKKKQRTKETSYRGEVPINTYELKLVDILGLKCPSDPTKTSSANLEIIFPTHMYDRTQDADDRRLAYFKSDLNFREYDENGNPRDIVILRVPPGINRLYEELDSGIGISMRIMFSESAAGDLKLIKFTNCKFYHINTDSPIHLTIPVKPSPPYIPENRWFTIHITARRPNKKDPNNDFTYHEFRNNIRLELTEQYGHSPEYAYQQSMVAFGTNRVDCTTGEVYNNPSASNVATSNTSSSNVATSNTGTNRGGRRSYTKKRGSMRRHKTLRKRKQGITYK